MLPNAPGSGGEQWDSAAQTARRNAYADTEHSAATAHDEGVNVPTKLEEPVNPSLYPENDMNEYAFTPAPFNPSRIDRCRVDNWVLLFMQLFSFVTGIVAVATSIVYYKSPSLKMKVYWNDVEAETAGGVHQHYMVSFLFCDYYTSMSRAYIAFVILTILFSATGFIFALFPIICGRVVLCTYLVHMMLFICWLFTTISMILGARMYLSKVCNGTSLHSIGFRYGASFAMTATLFSLLAVTFIFLVVQTVRKNAKSRF